MYPAAGGESQQRLLQWLQQQQQLLLLLQGPSRCCQTRGPEVVVRPLAARPQSHAQSAGRRRCLTRCLDPRGATRPLPRGKQLQWLLLQQVCGHAQPQSRREAEEEEEGAGRRALPSRRRIRHSRHHRRHRSRRRLLPPPPPPPPPPRLVLAAPPQLQERQAGSYRRRCHCRFRCGPSAVPAPAARWPLLVEPC